MKYIKLYHSIWAQDISTNAFRTYCSLLRFMNTDTGYANVAMHKLAASVGISEKSISRGIRELADMRLVSVVEKHYRGHRLANGYMIHPQSGRYTKVPLSALSAPITASGFKLYAYLLKCADSSRRAFPSLRGIASAIGVTIQTVIEQIKELAGLKLLSKKLQIKRDKSFGHNLYQLFDCIVSSVKKERTRLVRQCHKDKKKVKRRLKKARRRKTVLPLFDLRNQEKGTKIRVKNWHIKIRKHLDKKIKICGEALVMITFFEGASPRTNIPK